MSRSDVAVPGRPRPGRSLGHRRRAGALAAAAVLLLCAPSAAAPGDEAKALYRQGVAHYKKYVELHRSDPSSRELAEACDCFAQSLKLQLDAKTVEGLSNCRSAQQRFDQGVGEISAALGRARKSSPPPVVSEARKALNALKERRWKAASRFAAQAPAAGPCDGGGGAAQIIINEIGANEPGSDTAGEFVELVNVGTAAADLGGFTIADGGGVRHTFPAGTRLDAGKAIVVFGGPSGIPAGVSNAVAASSGGLSLANEGDSVTLADGTGAVRDSFTYSPSLAAEGGLSMNRHPDGLACAPFLKHSAIAPLPRSPGKRANGAAF
ncbi:MAG TPA: lamin tail domain-containing protein [Polyangiaceae bacterium]|nr:lamin tail domain-containing protein [Polyangiaceae bacterium]